MSAVSGYSNGVDLNFWSLPAPTVTCEFPCQFSIPCSTLTAPITIDYPEYTTSLCKPACGSIQYKSTTKIKLPSLTTDRVCFWPGSEDGAGQVTPVPRWETGTQTINVPKGLETCVPHHGKPDKDKKCGPDSHYKCGEKECCSKDGKCGKGKDFCGDGCLPNWGRCWENSTSCDKPTFEDSDDKHAVPIFPVWYDMPTPQGVILPPAFPVISGKLPGLPKCKDLCDDITCKILGCGADVCGILACGGFDTGIFGKILPKIGCKNIIIKVSCKLFKIGCCKKDTDEDIPEPCSGKNCFEDGGDPIAIDGGDNGDPEDPDDEDEECETLTTSHLTASCTFLTDAGTSTQTSCTSIYETITGCDVTGVTSTYATTACINTNTRATDVSVSCFATNVTTTGGTTIQGSGTCTAVSSSVRTGCDLTGTTTSITSFAEEQCDHKPSDVDVELATVDMKMLRRSESSEATVTGETLAAAATTTAAISTRGKKWWAAFGF